MRERNWLHVAARTVTACGVGLVLCMSAGAAHAEELPAEPGPESVEEVVPAPAPVPVPAPSGVQARTVEPARTTFEVGPVEPGPDVSEPERPVSPGGGIDVGPVRPVAPPAPRPQVVPVGAVTEAGPGVPEPVVFASEDQGGSLPVTGFGGVQVFVVAAVCLSAAGVGFLAARRIRRGEASEETTEHDLADTPLDTGESDGENNA